MISDRDAEMVREMYARRRRFAAVVGRADVDPDDLLHEAWARTLSARSLDSLDNPGAYLRKAIVNLAAGTRRRRARYQRALIRLGPAEDGPTRYPSDVQDLLRLAPRDRAVLYLRDIEGRGYDEVSEIVGRPQSTCRVIASRARKNLGDMLEQEDER